MNDAKPQAYIYNEPRITKKNLLSLLGRFQDLLYAVPSKENCSPVKLQLTSQRATPQDDV